MAFVILSAGALTKSKPRTLSMRLVLAIALGSMLAVLSAGVALGIGLSRVQLPFLSSAPSQPQAGAAEASDTSTENRLLIDRFGELSGRMMQLEAEAKDLAFRIGIIKESEGRGDVADAPGKPGRVAKTPPGSPSGGPLMEAGSSSWDTFWFGLMRDEPVELGEGLARLEGSIERVGDLMRELDRSVVAMNLAHMARPGREPVRGAPVISSFGNRIDPFTRTRAFHSGIDYPAPKGTPIYASAGGRVIYSGYRAQYGNTVEIDHGGGLVTRYAHASALLVKVGQVVMPGEQIAKVGSTGRSTGPHLHFEILRDGRFVDPKVYLATF